MPIEYNEARDAWVRYVTTPVGHPNGNAYEILSEYFKAAPSPVRTTPKTDCGPIARYGQDEIKCLACGRIWSKDEPQPDCFMP